MKQKWITACNRTYNFTPLDSSDRVCSDHFDFNDYDRDLQAELLCLNRAKKLKSNAVPHLCLNLQTNKFEVRINKNF